MNLNFSTVKYFVFFRVGFGLICDYRFQTMVLIGTANAFAGRLKPLDDMHRRCQNKSLRAFVVKKSCLNSAHSAFSAVKNTFLKKQSQFYAFFGPKTPFRPKTKPIQTQFKPNSNPIQTQFFGLKMNNLVNPACPAIVPLGRRRIIFSKNTVLICVTCRGVAQRRRNQCLSIIRENSWIKTIPFYAKRTQTSSLSAQKPRFHPKTNPKRTQTKPNGFDAKMNIYPLLTVYYEIL